MPKCLLAIDLGTSGPKVGLASVAGQVLAAEIETMPLTLLPNGGAEQNPDDWWNAIVTATRRLLAHRIVPLDDIVGVSVTSMYSSTVAVDADGRPLMDAILWMDTRGARYVKAITEGLINFQGYGVDKLLRWLPRTGGLPTHSGKDSIAHILFLKHERPDLYRAAHKFLEPKDYLNYRLTGKFAATYDSIILHWLTDNRDINRVSYNPGLLRLAGVDGEKFPELMHATDILGPLLPEAAAELGLPAALPVVAGCTDAQSAAIGSGAVRDYEGHLYLGTSAWLSCHVPFKKTDIFNNMASLPSAIPGRYAIANEQECAGVCLTFLRDHLFFAPDELPTGAPPLEAYALFDRLAARAPAGSDGLIFTPWLVGERTPIEDHTVRGGFFNLSLKMTRENLVRAVFEGVACNARWLLGCVEQFTGRPFEWLNCIGGGAKSALWCQIQADVLNRAIRQVKDPVRANVRGAALIAAVGLGYTSFDQIAAHVEIAETFRPDPDHRKVYDELFREFLNIYKNNRAAYARLNHR
jgi:xylulokinase